MSKFSSGTELWWNNRYVIADYFRKQLGEPVECLRVEGDQLVSIRTLSGDREERVSESYLRTSPN